jgi:hypothetical protein
MVSEEDASFISVCCTLAGLEAGSWAERLMVSAITAKVRILVPKYLMFLYFVSFFMLFWVSRSKFHVQCLKFMFSFFLRSSSIFPSFHFPIILTFVFLLSLSTLSSLFSASNPDFFDSLLNLWLLFLSRSFLFYLCHKYRLKVIVNRGTFN